MSDINFLSGVAKKLKYLHRLFILYLHSTYVSISIHSQYMYIKNLIRKIFYQIVYNAL